MSPMDRVWAAIRAHLPLRDPARNSFNRWYLQLRPSGGGIAVQLEKHCSNGWTEKIESPPLSFRVPASQLDDPREYVAAELLRLGVTA